MTTTEYQSKRIEIKSDEQGNGALYVWLTNNEAPDVYQPTWPDGTPWKDETEMVTWAKVLIDSIDKPDAPQPGPNPGMPTIAPVAVEDRPLNSLTPRMLNDLIAAAVADAIATK